MITPITEAATYLRSRSLGGICTAAHASDRAGGAVIRGITESGPRTATLAGVCGVVGIHAPGQYVSHLTYLALYALQHRGQEAAGMAVSDGTQLTVVKDQGLVVQRLRRPHPADPRGPPAVGHTRYSHHRLVDVAQRPAGVA